MVVTVLVTPTELAEVTVVVTVGMLNLLEETRFDGRKFKKTRRKHARDLRYVRPALPPKTRGCRDMQQDAL